MFHYRNHGSAYGRVVGLQVPAGSARTSRPFSNELGYDWQEETNNPAYALFLGPNSC